MVDEDTWKRVINTVKLGLDKPPLEVFLQAINVVPRRLHGRDFGVDHTVVHCGGVVHLAFGYYYDGRYAPGLFCEVQEVFMSDDVRVKELLPVTAAPVNATLTCLMCIAERARRYEGCNGP